MEADVPEIVKAAFDIAGAIMLYEAVPSITKFLQEQGTGLTFDEAFDQVTESMQGFFKGVALPPNRPSREVYDEMLIKREQLKDAISHHFEEQGIIALAFPAISALPPRIGEEAEVEIGGKKVSFFVAFGRNTALSPVAGMAGLVLPAGLSAGGLPIGLEFDALAGKDRDLLRWACRSRRRSARFPLPASEFGRLALPAEREIDREE